MGKISYDLFENQEYNPDNFFLMAGPCVVEGRDLVNEVAEKSIRHLQKTGDTVHIQSIV